eukprot:scaffold1270_cov71-Cylindrotheca_fusiformis.AAC.2
MEESIVDIFNLLLESVFERTNPSSSKLGGRFIAVVTGDIEGEDFGDTGGDNRTRDFPRKDNRKGFSMPPSSNGSIKPWLSQIDDSGDSSNRLFLDGGNGGVTIEISLRSLGVSNLESMVVVLRFDGFGGFGFL